MLKYLLIALCYYSLSETFCAQTDEHIRAVQIARQGHPKEALDVIENTAQSHGWYDSLAYDYVVILSQAKEYRKAFNFFEKNVSRKKDIPVYVIESMGQTCLALHKTERAKTFYKQWLKVDKDNITAYLKLAEIAFLENEPEIIPQLFKRIEKLHPQNLEILQVLALAYRRMEKFPDSLRYYNKILDLSPQNKEAIGGQAYVLDVMGVSYQAGVNINKYPQLFEVDFTQKDKADEAGVDVQWGRATAYPQSYVILDKAIKKIYKLIDECQDPDLAKRLKYDLIIALNSRQLHKQTILEYEALLASEKDIRKFPIVVLEGVGDSYLSLRQLDHSKEVFQHILERNKENPAAIKGYYYSILENEELTRAGDFIAKNSKIHKPFYQISTSDFINPDRATLEEVFATSYLYTDLLSKSEDYLTEAIKIAPLNSTYRGLLAETYLSRGLPRTAQKHFKIGLSTSPKDVDFQKGYASTLLALNRLKEAEEAITYLRETYVDNLGISKLNEELEAYKKRELDISVMYDDSHNPTIGTGTLTADMRLYSQPMSCPNIRAFLSTSYMSGKFQEGTLNALLMGMGLQFRNETFNLLAEINTRHYKDQSKVGSSVEMTATASDHWSFYLRSDINSRLTPGRALTNKIDSNYHQLSAKYYKNESFEVAASSYVQTFSDKNRWLGLYSYVQGRVLEKPAFDIDLRFDTGTRKSKTDNVPYFSPLRDHYVSLSPIITHRLYRNYEFSFKHIITPSVGNYWQRKYQQNRTYALTYEHVWERVNLFRLSYGVSRRRNSYDGQLENSTVIFANFNLRF